MRIKRAKTYQHFPKFKYEKEDDVLSIWLSEQKIDYAEDTGDVIVHFTQDNEPVYMEILDASHFLKREAKDLPREIKQKFFSISS